MPSHTGATSFGHHTDASSPHPLGRVYSNMSQLARSPTPSQQRRNPLPLPDITPQGGPNKKDGKSTPPPPLDDTTDPTTTKPSSPTALPPEQEGEEEEESEASRLDRLGRLRPTEFPTLLSELAFAYSILASQMMAEYFVSGFNVLLPTITTSLAIPAASSVWPASAISLTTAAFLLPMGRVADMYGGYPVYLSGLAWMTIWSLIAGFAATRSAVFLDVSRAMQGLGGAAFLPSGVMLLGSIYRPGPRKNLMFALYGSAAPLGFFIGIFFAGVTGSYLPTGAYFWIGAGLTLSTLVPAIWCVPSDMAERRKLGVRMDWGGSGLIVTGLILFVFAITDASHAPQGWTTPYILVTLVLGVVFLAGAVYWEGWVASNPLLPPDLFKVPMLSPLFLALLFSYGVLGVFLLYSTLYMEDIMGATPLQVAAWYVPMSVGWMFISVLGGYILHILPGTVLILVAGGAWCLTSLLFALAPRGANYWAYVFPAMIGATVGIDLTFNVANVFISTSLSRARQGLAGAVINTLLYLGIAVCLAFGDVTQSRTTMAGLGKKESYQAVFWYQFGLAAAALGILLGFVRIRRQKGEETVDEREEREEREGREESERREQREGERG